MSFVLYDIGFLILFTLLVVWFLYTRKHNLKRQGLMYLYRTRVGIQFIEKFSKRYQKILKPLQYFVVACGYALMIAMLWMIGRIVYLYTVSDTFIKITKIPPVLPLVPYLPSLFKVDFLPPFYFTYWIVIIAVVAIVHEFAHGIFARLNNIKVHSTGFGFLGPFLAAFVEPDEKQLQKSKKFPQLAILAAGTFANIVTMIVFLVIMVLFFWATFVPAGVNFNSYATAAVNVSTITLVNGISPGLLHDLNSSLVTIQAENRTFLAPGTSIETALKSQVPFVIVYEDAPAIQESLKGPITSFNGIKTTNIEELRNAIGGAAPHQVVTIITKSEGKDVIHTVTLGEKEGNAYLGIGIIEPQSGKITTLIYKAMAAVKNPFIYYEPRWGGDFSEFIYNLLWWMVLINFSVALANMLPVGMFDGGRFFYLTIWGITGSEKAGRRAFSAATWIILAAVAWLMIRWVIASF